MSLFLRTEIADEYPHKRTVQGWYCGSEQTLMDLVATAPARQEFCVTAAVAIGALLQVEVQLWRTKRTNSCSRHEQKNRHNSNHNNPENSYKKSRPGSVFFSDMLARHL